MADVLGKYHPGEPDELLALKRYIAEQFNASAGVGIQGETLVVTVKSASLANALRLRLPALKAAAGTTKRIVFRIN